MGNLTANVSDYEFKCKCDDENCYYKHDAVADFRIVTALQSITDYFKNNYDGKPVSLTITSGNRCCWHNAKVGGIATSKHTKALAVDFQIVIDSVVVKSYDVVNVIKKLLDLKVFDYKNIDSLTIHLEVDRG